MAIHSSLDEMANAAIDEYFQVVAYCLCFKKADGGCFGFPAALLLFCITDALGVWLRSDKVKIDGQSQKIGKCAFRVFNHECFGLKLTGKQISFLEQEYRNRLAHNALIDLGASLVRSADTPAFMFKSDTDAEIRLLSFHALVIEAWKRFPKEKIRAWEKDHLNVKKQSRSESGRK